MTAGVVTVQSLIDDARSMADMVGSNFVTDAEIVAFLNAEYYELYDLLVQKFGDDYFVKDTPATITTDGINERFALPVDFYKLLGVDIKDGNDWVTLKPFTFAERNRATTTYRRGLTELRYRLSGNKLWLSPLPQSGQVLRVHYVPRLTALAISNYEISAVEHYGTGTGTIEAIEYAGHPTSGPHDVTFVINGPAGGNPAGWKSVIIDGENVQNSFDEFIDSYEGVNLGAYDSRLENVQLDLTGAITDAAVWADGDSYHITIGDGGYSTTVDGVSGWEEFLSVGAAAQMLLKEESDASVLLAQKAEIAKRIENAASNRDAGMPARVADVRSSDYPPAEWSY